MPEQSLILLYPFSCPAFRFADEENKTQRSLSQQKVELGLTLTSDLRASRRINVRTVALIEEQEAQLQAALMY